MVSLLWFHSFLCWRQIALTFEYVFDTYLFSCNLCFLWCTKYWLLWYHRKPWKFVL